MSSDSQQTTRAPAPAGFWKVRHAVIGLGVLAAVILLMVRGCGDEEPEQQANSGTDKPRQAIVVQIPASQWPAPQQALQQPPAPPQPGYGYVQPQVVAPQPQAPVSNGSNPWAVPTRPRSSYGQYGTQQQWGQPQRRQPQYAQPSTGSQYRPLEPETTTQAPSAPAVQQPVPVYRPMAPYDRLSGSSFGTPGYPYGGAYPGYYGQGVYGAPGGVYGPGWPGVTPGIGYPGYW